MKRMLSLLLVLTLLLPAFPAKAAEPASAEISAMVLRPDCAGIYYQCKLTGNTSDVAAWGVALSTLMMPDETNLEEACLYTRTTGTDTANSALLTGVLKQENTAAENLQNGETVIYSRPYVELTDGTRVFGDGFRHSLRQLLAAIDNKTESLSAAQKEAVSDLYANYIGVLHKWALPNLHATYAEGLALNGYDAAIMDTSVQVLEDASYTGLDLVSRMYTHAFTYGGIISKNVPDDAPAQLENGTASEMLQKMMVKPAVLNENTLMSGDILFAGNELYLYGAGGLRSLNSTGAPLVDTRAVLSGITEYTLLRPAQAMHLMTRTDMTAERAELNTFQEALIATAKAYWQRGERLQYADTRFTVSGSTLGSEFRWQSTVNAPEDCTLTDWGYTNCAAFCYEVYYQTFGYKLPNNMYTTANLAKYAASNGTEVYAYNRTKGSTQTEAEKAKVKADFLGCLQPGDILCLRREDNSGHALLYIGNGEILHSGGGTYNYTGSYGVETYEASVRRVRVEDYFFNPEMTPRGDIFTVATKLSVVRPMNIYTGSVNGNTQNRMENLEGIVAEKLSSHVRAQTADVGEEITFTYAMHNLNAEAVTLKIRETVPAQLEWVEGGNRNGSLLTWNVTVPAHGRASVSYTARVKAGTAYGTLIQSTESTVGGVSVKCEPIRVGKKLTDAQQAALVAAFDQAKAEGTTLKNLALVNELYRQATGTENIFASTDFATVTRGAEGCFRQYTTYSNKAIYELNPNGSYTKLLAPGLYGGYRLWASEFANDRTRLAKVQDLQVGDVLLGKTSSSEGVMLYLGEERGFVNMSTLAADTVSVANRLERVLAYGNYYAIMRPTQALEN